MSALESKLTLALTANQPGSSINILDDVLVYTGTHAGATEQLISLTAGASDQAVALGALTTVKMLLLISDQAISVKLNGGSALPCKNLFVTDGVLTSLSLSNAGTSPAIVRLYLLG